MIIFIQKIEMVLIGHRMTSPQNLSCALIIEILDLECVLCHVIGGQTENKKKRNTNALFQGYVV